MQKQAKGPWWVTSWGWPNLRPLSKLLTRPRGKPRPSGRGRIARTHLLFPVSSPIFSLRRQDMPCQPVERS